MLLTEEQKLLFNSAMDFARRKLLPYADKWSKNKLFPQEAIIELGKLGFMGMLLPEEFSGSNIGNLGTSLVIEAIAYGDASCSTILCVHNSVASLPILQFGTKEQQQEFLPKMATGEFLGCFCLTEADAGSDLYAIKLQAKKVDDYYILNGSKQFITSGKHANVAIVFAKTANNNDKSNLTAFIVPTNYAGYEVLKLENKMGQHASDTAQLNFNNLKLPAKYQLGNIGQGYDIAVNNLEIGRIAIASQCLGIAQLALDKTIEYAKSRITFGKPIIKHQAIAFKLAELDTQLTAARQLVRFAAQLADQQQLTLKIAAQAKLFASEVAESVCNQAIQIHGGYGYIEDFSVARLYCDVRVTTIYEGTSEIQKLIISKFF